MADSRWRDNDNAGFNAEFFLAGWEHCSSKNCMLRFRLHLVLSKFCHKPKLPLLPVFRIGQDSSAAFTLVQHLVQDVRAGLSFFYPRYPVVLKTVSECFEYVYFTTVT
jgi:hypothetical protein